MTAENWLDFICEQERLAHLAFFGQEFDLTLFRQILEEYGFGRVQVWQNLGLEVHFLPDVVMVQDANFPGWKIKPEKWFWEKLTEGKLLRRDPQGNLVTITEVNLGGIIVLVDTRLKPKYKDGRQMWGSDKNLLGKILSELRDSGKIAKYEYGPQESRFGVSAKEIDDSIIAEFAKVVGLEQSQVRLERTIEGDVIPQLYTEMPRKDDGWNDTRVWYDEFFEDASFRLNGGNSFYGGLANVDYDNAGNHWDYRSFRLLGVLGP